MCKFMSVCSDGKGKLYYFNWKIRSKILKGNLNYEMDSHTSIADYFGFKGEKEDKLNKYEFNPLTKELIKDQINTTDDSESVKKQLLKLDFKKVIPQLVIQPIIHPFKISPPKIVNKHIKLLKQWASVWDSVWDSVGDSVGASVWASVRDSVWASVGDSVEASVGASVWAYTGSFFKLSRKSWKYTSKIKTKGYPFEPAVELWKMGLVPSFDGTTWRLHGGKDAKALFGISKEKLNAWKKPKEAAKR
jgi:hypothetical protein